MLDLLVLMVAVGGAWLAAAFAALNYVKVRGTYGEVQLALYW
jgi:hypothetical protein